MLTIDIFYAIILGVVQGLTEWLQISSSGHLALLQLALGLKVPVFYDAILHVGTLAGVFAICRRDIVRIMKSIFDGNKNNEGNYLQERTMLWLIILGAIPTGIICRNLHSL